MTVTWDAVNGDAITAWLLIFIVVLAVPVGCLLIHLWRTRPQAATVPRTPDTQPIKLSDLFPDLDQLADDLASRPRIGEIDDQLPPPLLGTLPPVVRPSIPSAWRASGNAVRRADKRWLSGDADAAVRDLARAFREREERR